MVFYINSLHIVP